ncbi:MAG: DegT/DnrJ/EryC1/StrS family aminotransferase, partial [Candidatus Saccharicenans sp.]
YVVTLSKGLNRDYFIKELEKRGIPSRGYFAPIHTQHYIKKYVDEIPSLPVTEDIGKRTLALPFHNNLKEEEIDIVVEALKDVARSI